MRRDSSSHHEGGTRRWSVDTTAFGGKDGRVAELHCVEVEWAPDPATGRVCPREKPGSGFILEADLVLLALGFCGPSRTALVDELGIEKDPRGFIGRSDLHMTTADGVFVAGDMHRGASLVVRAMADGMQTARQVAAYLNVG